MALLRYNRYPGNFASPTTAYPQGAFKNRSSGDADDGSYAEADWLNDWDGFFGRLLTQAEITPNGSVDSASSSQYYDALMSIIGARIPTGMVVPFAVQVSNPQYLLCDGTAKSRVTYASLFKVIGTTFGTGDGSTTFNLPDYRAEFLRGADLARGVDIGRSVGSKQGDAIRNIKGMVSGNGAMYFDTINPPFYNVGTSSGHTTPDLTPTEQTDDFGFDASLVVPTANENRPRNVAVVYYIKI